MTKSDLMYLGHIKLACESIISYTKGCTKEEFMKNKMMQDAIVRELEIIGEAVKNVYDDTKKQYTEIEWKGIAGMRDRIIHAYFKVDLDTVFSTSTKDVPLLLNQISKIIKEKLKSKLQKLS